MSGPQDLQRIGQMFGGPAGARSAGPRPTMPLGQSAKRLGDSRIPMSKEFPQRNPGAVQTQAAVKLGVRPNQVQPVPRTAQAPRPPQTPQPPAQPPAAQPPAQPKPPVSAPTLPTAPTIATPPPVPYPAMRKGKPLLPPSDPRGRVEPPLRDSNLGADMARILGGDGFSPGRTPAYEGPEPQGTQARREFQNARRRMEANQPNFQSAEASGGSPQSPLPIPGAPQPEIRPYPAMSSGGAPILPPSRPPDANALIQSMAEAARKKAAEEIPVVQTPGSTQPSPIVTPPVPPNVPPPPPPAVTQRANPPPPPTTGDPTSKGSQGTFRGYQVIPNTTPKVKTGNEKQVVNRGDKGNSAFLYRDFGPAVNDWDNVALGQAMKALRAKAADPKRKVPMTEAEVRILTKNADVGTTNRGVPLESMLPEALKRRMDELNSNIGKPGSVRTDDRILRGTVPPSATPGGPGAQPIVVPKTVPGRPPATGTAPVDPAVKLSNDAIQNPPPRNLTPEVPKQGDDGIYRWPDGTPADVRQE